MGLETTGIWGVNKIVAPFLLETPIDRYVYIYICMIIYIYVCVCFGVWVSRSEKQLQSHQGMIISERSSSQVSSCNLSDSVHRTTTPLERVNDET